MILRVKVFSAPVPPLTLVNPHKIRPPYFHYQQPAADLFFVSWIPEKFQSYFFKEISRTDESG